MSQNKPTTGRILVLDNSQDNLAVLAELFQRDNLTLIKGNDGPGSFDLIQTEQPDLIIGSCDLPGLNWLQLAERLRADPDLAHLPLLLLSARPDPPGKLRALEAGVNEWLDRPVQRHELLARARALIRQKRNVDQLIETARHHEQLFRQAEARSAVLSAFNDVSMTVGGHMSLDDVLNMVARKSCDLMQAESAAVYLCNEDRTALSVMAEYGARTSLLGRTLAFGEGMAGLVAVTAKPLKLNDYSQWSGRSPVFADINLTAVLCVPLVFDDSVIGVLAVTDNNQRRLFNNDDVQSLQKVAVQAALAITNDLLYNEIRQERDRLEAVLNSVKDGILLLDSDNTVALVNQRFADLLRVDPDEVVGQSFEDVAEVLSETFESDVPFGAEYIRTVLDELKRRPDPPFQREITIYDPPRRNLAWNILPVRDYLAQVVGWLNVFHDTTQQRELEKVREDFISMLVHDLRSPLTSIIGGIDLVSSLVLEGDASSQPVQVEFLENISRNCFNLLEMINTLLDVSRLEAGRLPLNLEPVNIGELLNSGTSQVQLLAQDRNITIRRELLSSLPNVNVDIEKLKRVIVNLLSNAIRHSPLDSEIILTAHIEEQLRRRGTTTALNMPGPLAGGGGPRRGVTSLLSEHRPGDLIPQRAMVISIIDQGPGIPRESQDRIFDKFTQLPGTSRNRAGTGLGLALCKLVIEAHGGRIWVESEEGQGSHFYFTIPVY